MPLSMMYDLADFQVEFDLSVTFVDLSTSL